MFMKFLANNRISSNSNITGKMLDQTQGGCGHFYNEVLSKTRGFLLFKSKVKMVFNYNDHQCRGNPKNDWIEDFDKVDDLKYKQHVIAAHFLTNHTGIT